MLRSRGHPVLSRQAHICVNPTESIRIYYCDSLTICLQPIENAPRKPDGVAPGHLRSLRSGKCTHRRLVGDVTTARRANCQSLAGLCSVQMKLTKLIFGCFPLERGAAVGHRLIALPHCQAACTEAKCIRECVISREHLYSSRRPSCSRSPHAVLRAPRPPPPPMPGAHAIAGAPVLKLRASLCVGRAGAPAGLVYRCAVPALRAVSLCVVVCPPPPQRRNWDREVVQHHEGVRVHHPLGGRPAGRCVVRAAASRRFMSVNRCPVATRCPVADSHARGCRTHLT